MEILTELGLGAHLMFYSDDAGTPPWGAMSPTEKLVIRYTLARLAGFPILLYNSGIDIDEYRNQAWVDWFGRQIRELDPYGHPVSSRYGGGSGDRIMKGQTFDSRGERFAKIADMTRYFNASGVPVSMDDAWGENRTRVSEKTFRPDDIRRAFWKCLAAGGLGGMIRGDDGYFHLHNLPEDLESEQWLKWINPFLQKELGRIFPVMVPDPTLVGNGFSLADPDRTLVMVLYLGKDDRWDPGPGGPLQIQGERLTGSYRARWFDPRTGKFSPAGLITAGKLISLDPPSPEDWVLLLDRRVPEFGLSPSFLNDVYFIDPERRAVIGIDPELQFLRLLQRKRKPEFLISIPMTETGVPDFQFLKDFGSPLSGHVQAGYRSVHGRIIQLQSKPGAIIPFFEGLIRSITDDARVFQGRIGF